MLWKAVESFACLVQNLSEKKRQKILENQKQLFRNWLKSSAFNRNVVLSSTNQALNNFAVLNAGALVHSTNQLRVAFLPCSWNCANADCHRRARFWGKKFWQKWESGPDLSHVVWTSRTEKDEIFWLKISKGGQVSHVGHACWEFLKLSVEKFAVKLQLFWRVEILPLVLSEICLKGKNIHKMWQTEWWKVQFLGRARL